MKTLISTSAIAFAAIVSASSAFACTNCNVALTATTPDSLGSTCAFTEASTAGTYSFNATTKKFTTDGSDADQASIGIRVRGKTGVTMTIDPTLYSSNGQTAIANVSLVGNYNPGGGVGKTSTVTNTFGGATQFSDTNGTNGTFGIATGARTGTDVVTFKVGGIATLNTTVNGADPLDMLTVSTEYTIKHVATCLQ